MTLFKFKKYGFGLLSTPSFDLSVKKSWRLLFYNKSNSMKGMTLTYFKYEVIRMTCFQPRDFFFSICDRNPGVIMLFQSSLAVLCS